jgi:hypothetical protein
MKQVTIVIEKHADDFVAYPVAGDKTGLLALKKHGITRILAPKALLKPLD